MPYIEQIVPAIDVVDVTVVSVGPPGWPRLSDFEPVTAVLEVRSAFHHGYLTDGKVVLTAKVRAEVLVGNSAMFFALLLVLIALFFVSSFFFVPVLILG
jgi:hypothetical protein